LENALKSKTCFLFYLTSLLFGWSEPTTTNAPIQDEAIQAGLGMTKNTSYFLA
jgi:hypothetical protein